MTVSDGVVGDFDDNYVYQSFFYLLPVVSGDAVNGDLAGSLSVFVPTSVAFYTDESREDVTYTPLMTTSDEAGVISSWLAYSSSFLPWALYTKNPPGMLASPLAIYCFLKSAFKYSVVLTVFMKIHPHSC